MTDAKLRFTSFLEFAASPVAFSAQTLGNVPNDRDEEEDHDPDAAIRKKLQTMMGTTQDAGESPEDGDARLFSILKGFLGHDDEDNHDEAPVTADDAPHDGEVADEEHEDEKHNQLLSAINDLRDELKSMKSGESQPQTRGKVFRIPDEENEEDGKDVCWQCNGHGTDAGRKCTACRGSGMVDYSKKRDHDHDYLLADEENEESYEENEENTKQARARQMFTALVNQGMPRQDIIDSFMKNIGVTNSTATSYYQRLAKEAGLTTSGNREMPGQGEPPGLGVAAGVDPQLAAGGQQGQEGGQDMEMPEQPESNIDGFEVNDDPNRQGLIRTVKGAHLVYKRKNEEGTYDELWVFGTGDNDIKDSLEVRRAILAGTDIPPRALKSENGSQSYTLTSLGNGQILHIKGLPN